MINEVAQVVLNVCQHYKVSPQAVLNKCFRKKESLARKVIIYYLHSECGISLNHLAKYFGLNSRTVARGNMIIRHSLKYEKGFLADYLKLFDKEGT
jgi:chromosomal replication initiation ATPase DnaA